MQSLRFSSICLAMAITLLVAAPWMDIATRWPIYVIGVASLAAAVISRLLND
jgi:hypothetical protein